MDSTTGTMERGTASQGSPADNATYNLLQTLTSKLEAIEAYGKYMQDADDKTRQFFESCRASDQQSAQQAMELLKSKLTGS
jgi:hypothetical protein